MQTKRLMTIATMWMVFVFGLGNVCSGQSYWTKTYGSIAGFYAIQPTIDGNFLIAGTNATGIGEFIKIKPNGDTLWTKTFADGDFIFAHSWIQPTAIQPLMDGNFLITGFSNFRGVGPGSQWSWLTKIGPNGDTLWTKTDNKNGARQLRSNEFSTILPTTDGNFLIVGPGPWLLKIKSNGDTLWTKTYGGASVDYFTAIQPTADGNFLITDNPWSNGAGNSDGLLLKIKPNGDTLWTKMYSLAGNSCFLAIQPTFDGNFLIAGYTWSSGAGNSDGLLLKVKPNGDTLWTKTYNRGGSDQFFQIQPTADGNFLIVDAGWAYGYIVKIKQNGDTLWTKNIYNSINGGSLVIQPTSGGNFKIVGSEAYSAFIGCVIADQYAYKDSLFTYKISTYSTDTLNFDYAPLKTPSGMTVSAGGTVSWTPKTDSVYMDHAEFLIMNDLGKKDTLTFNIFVNSDYHPPLAVKPSKVNKPDSKPFEINATLLSGKVKFSMPSFVKSICIYDINGRQVGKAAPVMSGSEANVIWPNASSSSSAIPTGKYIAKASSGMNSATKPFLLVR